MEEKCQPAENHTFNVTHTRQKKASSARFKVTGTSPHKCEAVSHQRELNTALLCSLPPVRVQDEDELFNTPLFLYSDL